MDFSPSLYILLILAGGNLLFWISTFTYDKHTFNRKLFTFVSSFMSLAVVLWAFLVFTGKLP